MLFESAPIWDVMSHAAQAEHYAQALREAKGYGRVANDREQRRIEDALRQHTPPLIAMRHDG
jgi:hypothetical protein